MAAAASPTRYPGQQAHRLATRSETHLDAGHNAEAASNARDALMLAMRWQFVSRMGRYSDAPCDAARLLQLRRTCEVKSRPVAVAAGWLTLAATCPPPALPNIVLHFEFNVPVRNGEEEWGVGFVVKRVVCRAVVTSLGQE